MPRDYASSRPRGKQTSRPGESMPGWVWMLCGLTVGLIIAIAVFIGMRPMDDAADTTPRVAAPAAKTVPKLPPRETARFKFYELLPNFELIPRGDNYEVEVPDDKPGRFLIQAGAFKKADDAERRKANLALLGVESRIERVRIEGEGTHYRVRVGPEADFGRIKQTMRLLAENDIDSYFIRAK